VLGPEGYQLSGESHLANISRDPSGPRFAGGEPTHQYPDGVMLFLGNPVRSDQDRGEKGKRIHSQALAIS